MFAPIRTSRDTRPAGRTPALIGERTCTGWNWGWLWVASWRCWSGSVATTATSSSGGGRRAVPERRTPGFRTGRAGGVPRRGCRTGRFTAMSVGRVARAHLHWARVGAVSVVVALLYLMAVPVTVRWVYLEVVPQLLGVFRPVSDGLQSVGGPAWARGFTRCLLFAGQATALALPLLPLLAWRRPWQVHVAVAATAATVAIAGHVVMKGAGWYLGMTLLAAAALFAGLAVRVGRRRRRGALAIGT